MRSAMKPASLRTGITTLTKGGGVDEAGGHAVGTRRVPDALEHRSWTAFTTASTSSGRIDENSGRLTRRVHTADATGRSAGRQPNVSS